MHRYWFSFDKTPGTAWAHVLRSVGGVMLGCGVTAHDRADAEALLRKVVDSDPVPPVTEVREDVDLTALDQGHVVPNMGNPAERGIWYPLGYDHTTPWRPTKDVA